MLAHEREEHAEEFFRFPPPQLTRGVAQHQQLSARHNATELRVAGVKEVGGGERGVGLQDAREAARNDRRGGGGERRVGEARGTEEEADPVSESATILLDPV